MSGSPGRGRVRNFNLTALPLAIHPEALSLYFLTKMSLCFFSSFPCVRIFILLENSISIRFYGYPASILASELLPGGFINTKDCLGYEKSPYKLPPDLKLRIFSPHPLDFNPVFLRIE